MTSHEYARKLLSLPDVPVVIYKNDEWEDAPEPTSRKMRLHHFPGSPYYALARDEPGAVEVVEVSAVAREKAK